MFRPAPNTVNVVDVDIPVQSGIIDLDGEPVEVFQYVALTLLDFDSSLPIVVGPGSRRSSASSGRTNFAGIRDVPGARCRPAR